MSIRVVGLWSLLLAALSSGCGTEPVSTLGTMDAGFQEPDASGVIDAGGEEPPCSAAPSSPDEWIVRTQQGAVQGAATQQVVRFLGVPFAAPPLGPRRFQPPAPHACWTDVRPATSFASTCAQRTLTGTLDGSEDCLYLNVWTPQAALSDGRRRPVMFWIHGGANVAGGTDAAGLYDGQTLADSEDVVVVTTAYRLGNLGFLAHASLSAEMAAGGSGSYGTLDQIAALEWVQDNITEFGGDPDRVLLFGESAGAFAVCTLVASPLATGLFSRALMQSGNCVAKTLSESESLGAAVADRVGCTGAPDPAECLRQVSLDDLLDGFDFASTPDPLQGARLMPGPAIDGYVLTDTPLNTIDAGLHNRVPMIVGSNAHEYELFAFNKVMLTCLRMEEEMAVSFREMTDSVLNVYPCNPLNPREAFIAAHTDMWFTCPARRAARAAARSQSEPVFRYWYTHIKAYGAEAALRAYHAAEIQFVFGTYNLAGYIAPPAEVDFSEQLRGYWSRFAATGDPNGATALSWGAYDGARDNGIVLDTPFDVIEPIADARCDFWDSLAGE